MADEQPTAATKRPVEPGLRRAYLVILGDAIERAVRDIRVIHDHCASLELPTGWFDVTDLELLEQRATAELLNGPAPEVHRLALDLQDFRALVRGEEVLRPGLRVILRDIGWPLMLDEINNAALEAGRRAKDA